MQTKNATRSICENYLNEIKGNNFEWKNLKNSAKFKDILNRLKGSLNVDLDNKDTDDFFKVFDNKVKIRAIAISQDNYMAIGEENGNLQLVNLSNTEDVKNLLGHDSWIDYGHGGLSLVENPRCSLL